MLQGAAHHSFPQHGAVLPCNNSSRCRSAHAGDESCKTRLMFCVRTDARVQLFEAAVVELKTAASRELELSRL